MIAFGENFIVPEAQQSKALALEEVIAPCVAATVGMLRSIGLDDQPLLEADEIDDIGIEYLLASKLESSQPAVAKHRTEFLCL